MAALSQDLKGKRSEWNAELYFSTEGAWCLGDGKAGMVARRRHSWYRRTLGRRERLLILKTLRSTL